MLQVSGVCLLGAMVGKYLWTRADIKAKHLAVRREAVPTNGALVVPESHLAVVQTKGGFLALDLTCTHLGCTVLATPKGFQCPCHGSAFDSEGRVLKGPAKANLRRFQVKTSKEKLVVSFPSRA